MNPLPRKDEIVEPVCKGTPARPLHHVLIKEYPSGLHLGASLPDHIFLRARRHVVHHVNH